MKRQTKNKNIRKVHKSGNSFVIAIPPKLRNKLNISENDILNIYEEEKKIILERIVVNE